MSQSDDESMQESMQQSRRGFEYKGNLTPAEIEEMLGYEFVAGPATVCAQIRRYYLKVKDNRPDKAAQLLAQTERFLSGPVESEQEVHDLSVILDQYVSGVHIYPDLTDEILVEKSQEFPRPLNTITTKADKPYQVWRHGKSTQALWKAWRQGRPTVRGYGMTEERAIDDLRYCVQPDHDGTLDGLGKPKGVVIGGNVFTPAEEAAHNRLAFEGVNTKR